MAEVGQFYYNVVDNNTGSLISSHNKMEQYLYSDAFQFISSKPVIKLGIQAPAGTKVVLGKSDNSKNVIMIGRTGIYEMDDIEINTMYFVQPINFKKNEEKSLWYKINGEKMMKEADEKREKAMKDLNDEFNNKIPDHFLEDGVTPNPDNTRYWEKYNDIQATYIAEYTEGLNDYNTGVNGVYDKDPINPYAPLNNVIVDYVVGGLG